MTDYFGSPECQCIGAWYNRAKCAGIELTDIPTTVLHLVRATIAQLRVQGRKRYWRNSNALPSSLVTALGDALHLTLI